MKISIGFLVLIIFPLIASKYMWSDKASLPCKNQVEAAAVAKLLGDPPISKFRILATQNLGAGVKELGSLQLDLYTVEISDEADGGVMIVFVTPEACEVHDVRFGTFALDP